MLKDKDYEDEMFYADEKIFYFSYYRELLKDMKNIVVMDDSKYHRDNIIIDFLNANDSEQNPAIIISNEEKRINKVKYVLEYEYDFVAPDYKDIRTVNEYIHGDRRKAFIFNTKEKGLALTLELAMMLNEKLISIGFKPLVIIECFDELYKEKLDETVGEYLDEVILKNTVKTQNIVVMSNLSQRDYGIIKKIDGNTFLMNHAKGIIVSKGYLYGESGRKEVLIDDFTSALNLIPNEYLKTKSLNAFFAMTSKLSLDGKEETLKEGFVLNIKEGKIGEFLVW